MHTNIITGSCDSHVLSQIQQSKINTLQKLSWKVYVYEDKFQNKENTSKKQFHSTSIFIFMHIPPWNLLMKLLLPD